MKNQENIAKRGTVVLAEYERKLRHLDILFHFVRYAFMQLSEAKKRAFVKVLKSEEEAIVAGQMEELLELGREVGISDDDNKRMIQPFRKSELRKVRANNRSKTHAQYVEMINDGMTSAEILFRVTIFEDFLKHVHATMLSADTKIFASARPQRESIYEEIFSKSFEEFKEQQICREVEELDRQSMKQRLVYFKKHLKIDFGDKGKLLIEISGIRNKIAHGNPLEAITKEDTTILLKGIQAQFATIIRDAIQHAFREGYKMHPRYFKSE